jgi:hypothetical protein
MHGQDRELAVVHHGEAPGVERQQVGMDVRANREIRVPSRNALVRGWIFRTFKVIGTRFLFTACPQRNPKTGEWGVWTRRSVIRRAGYAAFRRNVAVGLGNWSAAEVAAATGWRPSRSRRKRRWRRCAKRWRMTSRWGASTPGGRWSSSISLLSASGAADAYGQDPYAVVAPIGIRAGSDDDAEHGRFP